LLAGRVGRGEVQLRLKESLTLDQYVTQAHWSKVVLAQCPVHPLGGCGLRRHGYYRRRPGLLIARFRCPTAHLTISVLPDFLPSRFSGTLDEMEVAVATFERAETLCAAANAVRPPETNRGRRDPITQEATTRWLRRRVRAVGACLVAVASLYPKLFAGCSPTVWAFRAHLQTGSALVGLREIGASQLAHLPPPLGFGPRPKPRQYCGRHAPHKACPALGP
jgi:hypothetical protein